MYKEQILYMDDQPLMLYRQHKNNQVGINEGVRAYLKKLILIRQHWYKNQVNNIVELIEPSLMLKFNSYWFRVLHSFQFRRRFRDRLVLLSMFILGIY